MQKYKYFHILIDDSSQNHKQSNLGPGTRTFIAGDDGWGMLLDSTTVNGIIKNPKDPKFDPNSLHYDPEADVATITCEIGVISRIGDAE